MLGTINPEILFLQQEDQIKAGLLDMKMILKITEDTYKMLGQGQIQNPPKVHLGIPEGTEWESFFNTMPSYIGAMLVAAVIRNIVDAAHIEAPMVEIDALGNLSLSLFLAMALMALKLWQLADLAIPMIVMLLAQTVLMAIFTYFVVFNIMGRDYEAAVFSSATCGFGMGATPNAMANMQAVANKYGPAPRAFFVVPLVGSLFIDFFNSMIITAFLSFLG